MTQIRFEDTLAATTSERHKRKTLVIGGGFGGLAVAIRLQAAGHAATLVEARERLGGRAYQLKDNGFTFDMGPTLISAPHLLDDLWAACRWCCPWTWWIIRQAFANTLRAGFFAIGQPGQATSSWSETPSGFFS
jgi:choline dehydrogenase-like flavoprotein